MVSIKEYVEIRKQQLKEEVATFETKPKLCIFQIGDNSASNSYIRSKRRVCEELGIEFEHVHIKDYEDVSESDLVAMITKKCMDDTHGVLIQLPIPDKYNIEKLQDSIYASKDVDGFKSNSVFIPCTPKGIIDWLEFNDYDFSGKNVVVLGRSKIVGKPLANLLIDRQATVTCCNSKTRDVDKFLSNADLIISAVGKPKFFMTLVENTIIVDVGINRDENGKLCGDVNKEFIEQHGKNNYITPVPGGVGLLTVISLMDNVISAYKAYQ